MGPVADDSDDDDDIEIFGAYERTEQRAIEEQEKRLKLMRKFKLRRFWTGIKKEPELFVVFGSGVKRRSASFISSKSKSNLESSSRTLAAPDLVEIGSNDKKLV